MVEKAIALEGADERSFFHGLGGALVSTIENYCYRRDYEPRQIIYFPDDACDTAFWVVAGRVKVTRVSGDGRELTFRHLFPGDLFGEECLVEAPRRGAYAEAMEATTLLIMRDSDFGRLAREERQMALRLSEYLCRRAVEMEHVLAETVFKSVRSRVASGLLRLYQRAPGTEKGFLKVTHQELANLIGSTRETTTAVLHELREEGILEIANRRLSVLDPVALEQAARSG